MDPDPRWRRRAPLSLPLPAPSITPEPGACSAAEDARLPAD